MGGRASSEGDGVVTFELDPDTGAYLFACGHKGAGKSKFAEWYFRSYPYARLVIDSNSDVDPEGRFTEWIDPAIDLVAPASQGRPPVYRCPVPDLGAWAASRGGEPGYFPSWRYEPDFSNAHWRYVVDAVMGEPPTRRGAGSGFLGLGQPVAVWIDEIGEFDPVGQTPPKFAQVLHKGRHAGVTLIMSGPRPKGVDPLCLSQADLIAMFDTPHALDRERLAEHVPVSRTELDALLDNLEEHGYLLFEGPPSRELSIMAPLPLERLEGREPRGEADSAMSFAGQDSEH